MNKLLDFIRSIYVVLLFVLIEGLALHYYARSSAYTQAKLLTRSNAVVGRLHSAVSGTVRYFTLGRENRALLERVAALEEELTRYREAESAARIESYLERNEGKPYRMTMARVIANSISRSQNLIVLNRGTDDGVRSGMAVLSPDGAMAGYVVDCSERYAVAISILNTAFRASGRLPDGEFSSLYWNGRDRYHVLMTDLSKYADLYEGAEVVSTGYSQFFPPDVLIGYVESYELNETRTAYEVVVRLAAEISRLDEVVLVEYLPAEEIEALVNSDTVKQQLKN